MENSRPKDFNSLTDDEISAFRAELAECLPIQEVSGISWLRRALLMPDGTWRLTFRQPKVPARQLTDQFRECPWGYPHTPGAPTHRDKEKHDGTASDAKFGTIAEVIALLTGEASPEAELARREELFKEAWRLADERQAAFEQNQRDSLSRATDHKRRRPERWAALPQLQKAMFLASAESPRSPGAALEAVADFLNLPPSDGRLARVPRTFEKQYAE